MLDRHDIFTNGILYLWAFFLYFRLLSETASTKETEEENGNDQGDAE